MNESRKKILAISGSTKSASTSLSILKFIKEHFQDLIEFNVYNRISTLPHFNPELEEQLPDSVQELRTLINDADGLLFCSPEYVYSLPGSLKNLLEWNVSTVLFSSKPVAMIIAAASGQKAYESLDLILTTIEASLPETSKLLIQGAKGKIGSDGKIKHAETVLKIETVIASLVDTIDDESRKPTKLE